MGTPRRDMYKFVWDEGEDPDADDVQTSPKDIVANILRETELPELHLTTESNTSLKSKNKTGLNTEQELFSIDDDGNDFDFENTFSISGRVSQQGSSKPQHSYNSDRNQNAINNNNITNTQNRLAVGGQKNQGPVGYVTSESSRLTGPTKTYERKPLAKKPPQVSVQHPALSQLEEGVSTFNAYVDKRQNSEEPRKVTSGHKSALLEMEFDEDGDTGAAETEVNTDTQPIVTLDQGKLSARWQTRRQKINFLVALGLIVLGVVILTVIIIVIFKVAR